MTQTTQAIEAAPVTSKEVRSACTAAGLFFTSQSEKDMRRVLEQFAASHPVSVGAGGSVPARMPRVENSASWEANDYRDAGYAEGWNDCIDALTAAPAAEQGDAKDARRNPACWRCASRLDVVFG